MNIKHIRVYLLMTLISILMSGCNIITYHQQDPFYRNGSEWDHLRFPLIKPYYVIYISDKNGWQIPLETDPSWRDFYYYFTLQDIQKISVEKGVIMIYTPYKQLVEESVGEKVLYWFVFVPNQEIEMGFDNEEDFLAYIQQYDIQQPSWRTPDDILKEYDDTGCLDWIPDCK
jgi:hypothetical protein